MKKVILGLLGVVLVLGTIVVARTVLTAKSGDISATHAVLVELRPGAAERLAGALALETVSYEDDADSDPIPFLELHAHLSESYPLVHEILTLEKVNELSLLYTWRGSDPSLAPIILMGHIDVVPVEPGTEGDWEQPAFGGVIADGFVWGRGAIDDTFTVISILEAVEILLAEGFEPARTVYLAFGHDEEIGGEEGAQMIASLLADRGVKAEWVMDEGGAILEAGVMGTELPLAVIGIAEKGFMSVALTIDTEGGHSSMPPPMTGIGHLAKAIDQLQTHQLAARIEGPSRLMMEALAPVVPFGQRLMFSNLWLFSGMMAQIASFDPKSNAMMRTTTAPTIIEGGVKANVLPSHVRAVVNFRIAPWDSVEGVLEHVRTTIDDPEIEVALHGHSNEPSPVSPIDALGYGLIADTIRAHFSDAVVAPYLVTGGTDARYFTKLSPNVYRFLPYLFQGDDMKRFHGTNERISVAGLEKGIQFYAQLIRNGA